MKDVPSDPRAATVTIVDGPPELLGPSVIVEPVRIDGRDVLLPKPLPGVPEYVTVARSEAEVEGLRSRLLQGLDERGPMPYQPDAGLVLGFHAAAGTVVTEAMSGLEAFANHHLRRYFDKHDVVVYNGKTYSLREARDIPLNERLAGVLPEAMGLAKPTDESWWPTLRKVQGLAALKRHGVSDPIARKGLSGEKSLVQRFADREYRGAAAMMLKVFEFFSPGWIPPERMAQLPPPP